MGFTRQFSCMGLYIAFGGVEIIYVILVYGVRSSRFCSQFVLSNFPNWCMLYAARVAYVHTGDAWREWKSTGNKFVCIPSI